MRSELTARLTPEALIRGAHNLVRRHRSWKGQPLWTLVSELTCHGSTYSVEICRGLGFNPEHKIGGTLAPRAESETPVAQSCVMRTGCVNGSRCAEMGLCIHGEEMMTGLSANNGHGHVRPRPDGVKARCGGPGICSECSREAAQNRGA